MFNKQFTRTLQALIRQDDGLGFADRIVDHTFIVQALHRSPIMSLPRAVVVM